ncbi:hypothetical protein [Brevibacillus choshinensis]|uniref:hypothetical protein n=1 Tax=Brevibacillus choshinensis TaxID=54911 RepID=UPI002E1E6C19|nr:hypothetical protein [Brevibacillus choshinensis]
MGTVLVIKGASMAFAAGILLCVLLYGKDWLRGENEKLFVANESEKSKLKEEKAS